jgi:DNA-directed RNA polymerase specialized sigma24 family protein
MGPNYVRADPNSEPGGAVFATTHWSVVLDAGQLDSPRASEAMAQLCRTYWYPLYAYVRRKGYPAPDAQDLTQEFFARLLARNYVTAADRQKGKFRSFMLGTFEHFLAKEWRRAHAEKRGGGRAALSLDEMGPENRYLLEAAHELTPAKIFDRRWATTLLERAMTRLGEECRASQKGELFKIVEPLLSGDSAGTSYAELARSLNTTEGALKVAVHRLRQRYGELVRGEIAQTVVSPAEVDQELHYLLAALRE